MWTLSSSRTVNHPNTLQEDGTPFLFYKVSLFYFIRFLFSRAKALKLDSDHCLLEYNLVLLPVVLPCLFLNILQEI